MPTRIDLGGNGFIGRGMMRRLRAVGLAQRGGADNHDATEAGASTTVGFTESPPLIHRERSEPYGTH